MEQLIRRDANFQRLYNCSFYNVSDIPLEKRINVPIGLTISTVSIVEEVFSFLFIYLRNIFLFLFLCSSFTFHVFSQCGSTWRDSHAIKLCFLWAFRYDQHAGVIL